MNGGFYVYLHCKPDGTPFYVGKGCRKRAREFTISRTTHHKNTIAKYGRENVGVYVFPCESEREALDNEARWILQLREDGCALVNITSGGIEQRGYKHTDEARAKMSKKLIGNQRWKGRQFSAEALEKLAAASRGKKQSAETIARRIAKTIGRHRSPETRAMMAERALGRKHSPETKARLSEIAKRRTYSAETRERMSASKRARDALANTSSRHIAGDVR